MSHTVDDSDYESDLHSQWEDYEMAHTVNESDLYWQWEDYKMSHECIKYLDFEFNN